MDFVACSDGRNGLMNKYRWETQGDIPRFPYIGGHVAIPGKYSTNFFSFCRFSQWYRES